MIDFSLSGAFSVENVVALVALTALEIGLGVDNVAFQGLEVSKLPPEKQLRANNLGMLIAAIFRIAMLGSAVFLLTLLTEDLFSVLDHGVSGKDILLGLGGLFLLYHAVMEMYHAVEHPLGNHEPGKVRKGTSYMAVMKNIAIINIVFSLDSVLTAVGTGSNFWVMATAIAISVLIMARFSMYLTKFIEKHISMKLLAISFLLLIGANLCAEAVHQHMPKAFVYGPALFALFLMTLNIRAERNIEKLSATDDVGL